MVLILDLFLDFWFFISLIICLYLVPLPIPMPLCFFVILLVLPLELDYFFLMVVIDSLIDYSLIALLNVEHFMLCSLHIFISDFKSISWLFTWTYNRYILLLLDYDEQVDFNLVFWWGFSSKFYLKRLADEGRHYGVPKLSFKSELLWASSNEDAGGYLYFLFYAEFFSFDF